MLTILRCWEGLYGWVPGHGNVRQEYGIEPGLSAAAIKSSFAVLFADAAQQAMSARGEGAIR